jgi:hypothetical protein
MGAVQEYHNWLARFVAKHKDSQTLTVDEALIFHETGFKLIRQMHEITASIFHREPYAKFDDAVREAWNAKIGLAVPLVENYSLKMLTNKGEELFTRLDIIKKRSVMVRCEQQVASACEEILQEFLEHHVENGMPGRGIEVVLMLFGSQKELAKLNEEMKKAQEVCELLGGAVTVVAEAVKKRSQELGLPLPTDKGSLKS